MRAATVAPKLPVTKPKLRLPPPRAPFRVFLERAPQQSPTPPPPPLPALQSTVPRTPPAKVEPTVVKRSAPKEREEPLSELDSAARTSSLLAPPPQIAPTPQPQTATPTMQVDQQLAVELVERAAFWGDGTRGLARLRFNGKARAGLANATVTLEHDGDETHLRVEGIDPEVEQELRERLAARGVTLSGES